uniref:Cytochrome c oxidase subunit 2 n=1 Tax=Xiphinema americanum TaxID=208518 RepID=Q6TY94_XIPAM|nr:cytochrome c oxidase subunit II [Xiphinema americanum]AAQ75778.1 cytochrome c oxidase subunit 2 [Xiphinema americanum]
MPFWGESAFQNFSSGMMSSLETLHDPCYGLAGCYFGSCFFGEIWSVFFKSNAILSLDSLSLEVIWSCLPMVILASVAFPSLLLLSKQETLGKPLFTLKMISNQWSWASEYDHHNSYDHLLDFDEIEVLSNLETPVFLPSGKVVRILLSSSDVLHSLGLPSLGVKLDSVPGRINSTIIDGSSSVSIGSCYELCGTGHSAMPVSFILF